ncbi:MAG: redoxin domain-containing protein [Candidatus Kariarchaeaceae archaeon]
METSVNTFDFKIKDDLLLSQYISQFNGIIILFFHQCKNIGCQIEIKSFRDKHRQFQELGWEIIGVSSEARKDLEALIKNLNLDFPLISDIDKSISMKYQVLGTGLLFGPLAPKTRNCTIIVDNNLNLLKNYEKLKPLSHASDVLGWVSSYTVNLRNEKQQQNQDLKLQILQDDDQTTLID